MPRGCPRGDGRHVMMRAANSRAFLPTRMPAKPLSGVRVLDLTRLLPGPMATMHLADLGADVIKIEEPGSGDQGRGLGPMNGETSWFFQVVNRNKRSLRLDLKQPEGTGVFLRLARNADVILEGFRPGVADRLGIGYAAASAVNPRLVYCAITGYGQTGPLRERAGHDINYLALSGALDQICGPGGAPVVPNLQIGDLLGGAMTSLVAVLAALLDARASGRGRYVDVAMTDAVLAHAILPLVGVLASGRAPRRGEDLLTGGVPCYGVYPTRDGRYMAVGALERKFWQRLCTVMGCPELEPCHLASGAAGAHARAELARLFRSRDQSEWSELFATVDCCVTPVLSMEEALDSDHVKARGMAAKVGGVTQFAPPFGIGGCDLSDARPAPAVGADGESILRDAGYSPDQIEALRAAHVI